MKNAIAEIKTNRRIARDTYEMEMLITDVTAGAEEDKAEILPGQFINIKLDGLYLRRPISICDWTEDTLTIIYKTVGKGTEQMSRMRIGEKIDILYPLGNGYSIENAEHPLLIGGGAGLPPMIGLCRRLIETGAKPVVIAGFKNASEVFGVDQIEKLGAKVIVTTEDGSEGVKGFVTEAINDMDYDCFFACGPEAMLKAVDDSVPQDVPGQLSFERRMGCGFGACMGCSCRTKYGSKRICVDGPVLERSEIIW